MTNTAQLFILERTKENLQNCKKTGVYKIYHIIKPEIYYIGSAASITKNRTGILNRWICHIKDLKLKKHRSTYLQRVVDKHGLEGLRFEILEFCEPEKCIEREQYYLDLYQPFGKNGYNTAKIAGNSNLGVKVPFEKRIGCKKVCKYDLDGNFIETYISVNEAARQNNTQASAILDVCNYKRKFNNNYLWRYFNETKEQNITPLDKNNKRNIKKKEIYCYFDGVYRFKGNINEILLKVPDKKNTILNCIQKNIITTKTRWLYRYDYYDKLNFIHTKSYIYEILETNEIFTNKKKLAKKLGISFDKLRKLQKNLTVFNFNNLTIKIKIYGQEN